MPLESKDTEIREFANRAGHAELRDKCCPDLRAKKRGLFPGRVVRRFDVKSFDASGCARQAATEKHPVQREQNNRAAD